jgi:hypothetical protein
MSARIASSRGRLRRARSWFAALAILAGALGSAPTHAEQTVRFDGAGDAPRVSLIGDSTLAGVRWYADYGALQRFNFVLDAESCRRTFEPSCISREGFRSDTVVETIRTLDGELGEVLVVMTGYNDPEWAIDESIAAVMDAARSGGVGHLVWLSLRMTADVAYSDPQQQSSVDTFREYNEQLVEAARSSGGFLQIADWATYSTGATEWFETDGVHLTGSGVDALTVFIAGTLERVLAGEDVSPAAAPWAVLVPGAEGDLVAAVQSALIEAGIELRGGADGVYGNGTMAAVAAYQRREGTLQVTGAVDAATARSLGVYDAGAPVATVPTAVTTEPGVAATAPTVPSASVASVTPLAEGGSSSRLGAVALGLLVIAVTALLARRRHVVRRRIERGVASRPATAPGWSVADDRRAGPVDVRHDAPPP